MNKVDFSFSKEGDLELGPSLMNAEGEILYRHGDDSISTVAEGGKRIKDFTYRDNQEAMKQIVMNRLKTDNPDWYHHKGIGGDLSDLIGEPNTKETAMMGVERIQNALTYKGLLSSTDFLIRPVPISEDEILFMLTINLDGNEPYRLPLVFDLKRGLKEV